MDFRGLKDLLERFGISSWEATDAFEGSDSPHNVFEGLRARVMIKWDEMGAEGREILAEDYRKLMSLRMTRFELHREIDESDKKERAPRKFLSYSKECLVDILSHLDCVTCDKKEICPDEFKMKHVEDEKLSLRDGLTKEKLADKHEKLDRLAAARLLSGVEDLDILKN